MPSPRRQLKRRVADPVSRFMELEASGGLALLLGSGLALLWVNLIGAGGYESFWGSHLRVGVGALSIEESLLHWVNDGLMTLFFFLISLEIKREIVTGELRHPKAAALPILAALGGVLVPIAIFLAIVGGGTEAQGWGIPMATDAAFAIGVLALLGSRVSSGVKLFLVTLAVVDDVAAICVIAVAYTGELGPGWLVLALAGLGLVVLLRRLGVRAIWPFAVVGVLVWIATLESGIHATLAGVALAFLTPARPVAGRDVLGELESRLHPFVNFAVLPVFALANAGVVIGGSALSDPQGREVALAVGIALVVGKFVGVGGTALVALRTGLGRLPSGVDRRELLGAAAIAGIGFTVSLFIAPLAYADSTLVDAAKLGILGGSIVATLIGTAILLLGRRQAG